MYILPCAYTYLFSDFLRLSCEKTIRGEPRMKGERNSNVKTNSETLGTLHVSEAALRIANGQIVTTYNVLPKRVQSTARGASTILNYSAVRSIQDHQQPENPVSRSANVRTDGVRATSFLLSRFFFFPAVRHEPPVVAPGLRTNDSDMP